MLKKCLKIIFWFVLCVNTHAAESNLVRQPMSIDLQDVNLQAVLRAFAKTLNMNIVLSNGVTGTVTLHLQKVPAEQVFDFILATHGLTKILNGGIWLIGTPEELMHQQQELIKLQETALAVAPLATHIWQIHYARAEAITHLLQEGNSMLSKRGNMHMDTRTNEICVQDTAEKIQAVDYLIRRLDVPVQQVMIETKLVSLDSNYERELGVNFSVLPEGAASNATTRYSLAVARLADGSLLNMQLAALENAGHGELISSPRLFTANQQTAAIEAGEEIPYQEISRSGATGVAFKKAVLRLKVTPQIFPDGQILLELQINQDKPSNRMVLGVPSISTRQISTNILANNGQTVVLGGIFESTKDDVQQRIPFLGKIPLVGWLFRQQNVAMNKRELLIFVTPRTINSSEGKT